MKFEIRRVQNGAVLRVEPDYPDAETEEVVYQENETDEVEAFAEFLRYLVDHYGPTTSRYSPKRIYIQVKPGDKFDPASIPTKGLIERVGIVCGIVTLPLRREPTIEEQTSFVAN